jgi:hypothetical protein
MAADPIIAALRERRRDLGVSVSVLAAAIHYGRNTVYHWEDGTRRAPLPGLRAYCEALGGRLDIVLPTITPTSRHGRSSAVQRHRRSGEPLCEECRLYERERARAYRARRRKETAA